MKTRTILISSIAFLCFGTAVADSPYGTSSSQQNAGSSSSSSSTRPRVDVDPSCTSNPNVTNVNASTYTRGGNDRVDVSATQRTISNTTTPATTVSVTTNYRDGSVENTKNSSTSFTQSSRDNRSVESVKVTCIENK